MSDAPIIEAHDLSYAYPHPPVEALRRVSFALQPGTFTVVMGPNGSGKTTLLRLMLGLLRPTSGTVRLMGRSSADEPDVVQQMVGYVPQHDSLNLRLPVRSRDVLELGIAARTGNRLDARQIRRRVDRALGLVNLREASDRRYSSLSGGQRQRVLIARALSVDPHILLLDEPFSAMDLANQRSTVQFLYDLVHGKGLTVVAVVHTINTLVHFLDNLLLLNGELVAFGPPDAVLQPGNLRQAYGADVPVVICDEGYRHPLVEDSHA